MFEQAFENIDDVLWKEAGCTTELDYTEQTSCRPVLPSR
jgi:type I restriction enzyme M protein